MIIYNDNISNFLRECPPLSQPNVKFAEEILDCYHERGLTGEIGIERSWENSLPVLADAIQRSNLDPECGIAIEYRIKGRRNQIDFIVYGLDADGRESAVIIELKQWSEAARSNLENHVYTNPGGGPTDCWHPSYQAMNYANLLSGFNEYIQQHGVRISACSYMHNMPEGRSALLQDERTFPLVKSCPAFLKDDVDKLIAFLRAHVKSGDPQLLYNIEDSRIIPSPQLSGMLKEALEGNGFFSYDDAQAKSVSTIVWLARKSMQDGVCRTVIIKGGPGTGKSVVAMNALGELIHPKNGLPRINAAYVTANAAPRVLMYQELAGKGGREYSRSALKNLFLYPTSLSKGRALEYGCVLFDEAHRLFDFKGGVGISRNEHVLERCIRSTHVAVFFIDEDQAVTKDDYATIDRIRRISEKNGYEVIEGDDLELTNQFRVLGGWDYIEFVRGFLGYSDPVRYRKDRQYDFRVFDSASEMRDLIRERDREERERIAKDKHLLTPEAPVSGKCRLVAGYTYEWDSKGAFRGDDIWDIVLDDGKFRAKWNLRNASTGSDYSWLNDENSVEEVGCIHTCQGLDMNYCGVIIGKDMRYEGGHIVYDRTKNAKSDRNSGIHMKSVDDATAVKLIRNTYNVLLTRGMKGTYVYCEDKALGEYLKSLID